MDEQHLLEVFAQAAWEVDHKKFDGIMLDTRIDSLGIDSVALYEIFGVVEEELDLELEDDDLANVETLRDLKNLIA